ncbi:hypothetical protein PRIPAC_86825 [Pristionchus pacificus]|uniref:Uncharacterized protein n=1 Tax=Pristionchus pacificus TaxID=54126 RepID=A0A2A6BM47_PRIPA|nr:hypothetical protein PRIPAC_86825 [Pristionchus pacificus]|eukprot:PDM66990.1 hypothetical protein PRIPAC_48407 [Pristionchus pacificus]
MSVARRARGRDVRWEFAAKLWMPLIAFIFVRNLFYINVLIVASGFLSMPLTSYALYNRTEKDPFRRTVFSWFSMTNQVLTAGPIGMIYILKWFRPDVDNETVQSWEDILISAGIIHIVLIFFLLFGRKSEDGNMCHKYSTPRINRIYQALMFIATFVVYQSSGASFTGIIKLQLCFKLTAFAALFLCAPSFHSGRCTLEANAYWMLFATIVLSLITGAVWMVQGLSIAHLIAMADGCIYMIGTAYMTWFGWDIISYLRNRCR